ncbi:MAG: protein-L-isoaspartate O-methyltransferase [Rhizobiaceae bacterium]|nr:protein-L-isoaspartate O-methyltransferase [Rhizobiaceae bacterium]
MNIDYTGQRVKMVDGQVRTTDVTDLAIISALLEIPREEFVPERVKSLAYIDEDIALTEGEGGAPRFLMESSPFAKLVQLAEIQPSDLVLDVGCATGYSSAVLSRLSGQVIALESDAELARRATETLSALGCDNVAVVEGPLQEGYPAEAPYDAIILEGAVGAVPGALLDQLKEGGRLVAVEGYGNAGKARIYLKTGGKVTGRYAFNAAIKPLPGFEIVRGFEF